MRGGVRRAAAQPIGLRSIPAADLTRRREGFDTAFRPPMPFANFFQGFYWKIQIFPRIPLAVFGLFNGLQGFQTFSQFLQIFSFPRFPNPTFLKYRT
jgi:hypothetical protein